MWTEKSADARIEVNQPLCGEVRRMVPPPEVLKEKNFKYGNKCQKKIFNNFRCFWIYKILQKNS